jgi:biotin carboxyl carrier protein
MERRYESDGETVAVKVERTPTGYSVTVAGRTLTVTSVEWRGGELRLTVDGDSHIACVAADGPRRWVAVAGQTFAFTVPQAGARGRRGPGLGPRHDTLEAQMPGVVRKVLVTAGDTVERGQALIVLEAMKMEIRVAAPHAGRVEQVAVREDETVQRGQLLVDVVAAESAEA